MRALFRAPAPTAHIFALSLLRLAELGKRFGIVDG
jgi:hypothetical protein